MIVNRNINFVYPPHWHNAVELIYVLKNSFVVLVNSKKYRLQEKDIMYIPGGDIHEFCSETPTGVRIFINFEFSSLSSYINAERIYTQLRDVRLITPDAGDLYENIESELQRMLKEQQNGGAAQELFYTARMLDILVLLCRSIPSQIHMGDLKNGGRKDLGLYKISKSLEYIEKRYMEDIHLKDIANAAGFSEYYFSRLFKEITEKNFHQFLNEYRIKKAEELLADSSQSISETAYAVGFSSIATFDRVFRQIKGCSPKNYRKLYVNQ
ncbi:MAG: AraC family transcriptional regulator [Oscillospiraceae bacterium]|nr:AraC family transcriptional regulator [Oscillospiraceae bacterium]